MSGTTPPLAQPLARVVSRRACHTGPPAWSADGQRIAFVLRGDASSTPNEAIWTANADGSDAALLYDGNGEYPETVDNPPSWSPDGTTLAFDIITWDPTDTSLSQSLIATVPVAGPSGPVTRLTDPTLFASHPDWSPDGSVIAFNTYDTGNMHGIEEPSNVYTIAPDGSGLRQVSTASVDGTRIWVSIARDREKDSTARAYGIA